MFSLVALCFGMVVRLFRGRRSLLLENFALRQQRVALKRRHPRASLNLVDKLFRVIARRGAQASSTDQNRNRQTAQRIRRIDPALRASRPAISQWPAGLEPPKLENQIPRLTFTNLLTRRAVPEASFGLSIQLATCPLSMYFDKSPCNSFKSLYRRSVPRPRFSQF